MTNLEAAVRAWLALDAEHRAAATLTTEHAVLIDGASMTALSADKIALLANRVPGNDHGDDANSADDAG